MNAIQQTNHHVHGMWLAIALTSGLVSKLAQFLPEAMLLCVIAVN